MLNNAEMTRLLPLATLRIKYRAYSAYSAITTQDRDYVFTNSSTALDARRRFSVRGRRSYPTNMQFS